MRLLKNRQYAGSLLANKLDKQDWDNTHILALPRGGVPVAVEVAKRLSLPWSLLLVKKIGAPGHSEYAIGALSEDYVPVWNDKAIEQMGLNQSSLELLSNSARIKLKEQYNKWKAEAKTINLVDKTIILIDDGLATGLTMRAAVEYLKRLGVFKIVVAIPVASASAVNSIKPLVDDVISLYTPSPFFSVGQWYDQFEQVSDESVTNLLFKDKFISHEQSITIPINTHHLVGLLNIPDHAKGIIIFAHGSGSSHLSPRNKKVANDLNKRGFATLLFDLLTPEEELNRQNVFNIALLSSRLITATQWIKNREDTKHLPIGYFGASTGAAAALVAETETAEDIFAIVCRGGRPDMAKDQLNEVQSPSLLIVGGEDHEVIKLNQLANSKLQNGQIVIVPGATHLFEEPGALNQVIKYATSWFEDALPSFTSHYNEAG